MSTVKVLFVCLGNICRSPTAEGLFQQLLKAEGLDHAIRVDSAGTGDWHIGRPPDQRAQRAALGRGCDISHLRARQVTRLDFDHFNYIIAMDNQNLADLKAMKPPGFRGHLGLLLSFADDNSVQEVPDPYHGGEKEFQQVLDLLENAASGLLEHIKRRHGLP